MDGTSIDKLYLDIGVNAKGTTRTINSIYKSLDKLTSSISTFDAKGFSKKFDKLFNRFNKSDTTGFDHFAKSLRGVASAFNSITNASKIDTKGLYTKFNSLTRIITPFVDKVKEGETSLVALAQTLKSVKTPTSTGGGKTSNGGTNKTNKNLNIFATLGKWNYMINMARYYGRSLANIVQLSMDYVETQNLWQVANRNNLEMAEQFIQKMNKAYGVSEATLMNYQAIFKNMLSALGDLSDEISSGLSMQLTQMALDFSSLYNVTIPSAMQKFQAVLSGQVRPIRSVSGYDITENTIFDLYAGAGGEKTMRQLSQIEKRLLRIVAVFDQMGATGATGDMAKTIESASNQARIMNEQFKETMTWTGQIVLMWLDSAGVFQKINAFLITMKEIMRAMAYDLGYSEKNFLDGLVTSAEDAGEAVDDIQGKLLSFDKFEALNSNATNALGIDQTVLDLLEKINYETEEFEMEATKISDQWLTALGFIDENGDGIRDITEKAQQLLDKVKEISKGLSGFVLLFATINKPLTVIMGAVGYLYATNKDFAKDINETFASLSNSLAKIGSSLLDIMVEVVPVISKVVSLFADLISKLDEIGLLEPILWGIVGAMTALAIAQTIVALTNPFNWIIIGVGAVVAIIALLVKKWDSVVSFFKKTGEVIKNVFIGFGKTIANIFAGIINSIANGFISLVNFFIAQINVMLKPLDWIAGWFGGNVQVPTWNAKVNWQPFEPMVGQTFATGGFPEDGLFFANSGELVGKFSNGKTAVANNEQIVTGITQGVYSAMMAYNAQTRGQGGSGDVYLDGTKVGRVVAKGSHQEMVRAGYIKANS